MAAALCLGLLVALAPMPGALAGAAGAGPETGHGDGPPELLSLRAQLPPSLHFLQLPVGSARPLPPGRLRPSLAVAYSSIFQIEEARGGASRFEADLELLTIEPRLVWRPADRLELSVAVPAFLPGSGFLDRPIQDYHDFFDLPNGGREAVANDRFASSLAVDGRVVYRGEPRFGVGDLALVQSWRLAGGGERPFAVALRTGVELPTGDADRGYGSGEVDVAAALAATVGRGGWALHGQASWLLPGDLAGASRVETHAAYGLGVAVEAPLVRRRLEAVVQLDGRTPFASGTGLDALDAPLLQLTVGGALRIGGVRLTLGLAEDLRSGAAPDVTLLIRVSPRFD